MSERGNFRGGRGSSRGGDQRGGGRGGRGGSHNQAAEKPKKENILDLTKYMDKQISVKFNGGREGLLPLFLVTHNLTWGCMVEGKCLGQQGSMTRGFNRRAELGDAWLI